MAPKKTELQEVTLTIPLDQARKLQEAAGEVPYQLGNAANVFKLLWGLTSSGFAPPEAQLCAIYDLCARGLLSITEKEGDRLDTLDMKLRDALKPFPQEVTE